MCLSVTLTLPLDERRLVSTLPRADAVSWEKARACLGPSGLLSVIMPCHNLGQAMARNVPEVAAAFRGRVPFEIVAVDDGSADNTRAALEESRSGCPELNVVSLDTNHGKGQALRTGFQHTRGTHILFLDGDLDLPPYQAAWFFERMAETDADIVIGAKRHPQSELVYPLKRRIISATYYMIVRLLFGLPVRDTQTGIKLFRRAVLEAAMPRMLVKRFAYDLELLVIARRLKFQIAEAPVILEFHGPYGCVTRRVVHNIMNDTLAIFYRLHFLRYYDRNSGPAP